MLGSTDNQWGFCMRAIWAGIASAFLVLWLATAAWAQNGLERFEKELKPQLELKTFTYANSAPLGSSGFVLNDVVAVIPANAATGDKESTVKIQKVTVEALDFDRMKKDAKDDEAPRFAKLKLEGMTGDDEMFTALQPYGVPNVPFDIALDYTLDPATKVLDVKTLEIAMRGQARFVLSLAMDGISGMAGAKDDARLRSRVAHRRRHRPARQAPAGMGQGRRRAARGAGADRADGPRRLRRPAGPRHLEVARRGGLLHRRLEGAQGAAGAGAEAGQDRGPLRPRQGGVARRAHDRVRLHRNVSRHQGRGGQGRPEVRSQKTREGTMKRRTLVAAGLVLPALRPALAQDAYPSKPVQIFVPFPPGGVADITARPLAHVMGRLAKQSIVVVNKPGAGGSVGAAQAARAAPDGYTLLLALSSISVLPVADRLQGRPAAYELDQFAPVALISADPTVLVVRADGPYKTLKDLVDAAKAKPGTINYGSSGVYGTLHVAMEIFAQAAGIKMFHIPYQGGGPAVAALLAGQIDALASGPAPAIGQIKAGKMRALAVWGDKRLAAMPDVPSMKELGYDATFYIWSGLFAPAATPQPVMTALRELVKRTVEDPEFKEAMAKVETPIAYLDAPQFKTFLDRDAAMLKVAVERIGKVPEN